MSDKTINEQMKEPREILFAFTNGSYKKINTIAYDHKEWIVVKRSSGKQVFINTTLVKYIEEL